MSVLSYFTCISLVQAWSDDHMRIYNIALIAVTVRN